MKKILSIFLFIMLSISFVFVGFTKFEFNVTEAKMAASNKKYYTIYEDSSKQKILFLKGDEVSTGDKYLSGNNKLYEIESVDDNQKFAIAKFIKDEELPKLKLKTNSQNNNVASAATNKKIGVYHTHNDESYYTPDGVDSVYGKGGVHTVGKEFVSNLEKLKIDTIYREDLHLPHNSGAYTRSQVTASALIDSGAQAIFDLHRDSTKRSEYLSKVDGKEMSSVRMVVGLSSKNYEENKKFAYKIKSYADEVYPGLIKDIYFGKGNYNQGLTTKAMLFEMGCENIEKSLVLKTTPYLAKVVDVVLYGVEEASDLSVADITNGGNDVTNVAGVVNDAGSSGVNSNTTLYVLLGVLGAVAVVFALVMIFSKKARYKVARFFSETFAGIFGKKKKI
ncbi:MAG: stage II sporulation protein P [Clostridia bacterium]|nr:stage II sporulation protein P [Clostridia bacterium]